MNENIRIKNINTDFENVTSRSFLNDKVYLYTIRFLGGVLWVFAIVLFYDGLKLLGII